MWNLAVLAPSHSLWPHKMLSKLNEDKCTQHLHSVKFKTPHKEAFCFYKTLDGGGGGGLCATWKNSFNEKRNLLKDL